MFKILGAKNRRKNLHKHPGPPFQIRGGPGSFSNAWICHVILPNPNGKKFSRSNDTLTFDIMEELTSAQFSFLFFQTSTNLINAMTVYVRCDATWERFRDCKWQSSDQVTAQDLHKMLFLSTKTYLWTT